MAVTRHESKTVPVPAEVRRALFARFITAERAAKELGIGTQSAYAMLSPGGVIRPDVLERVRGLLEAQR